MDIFCLSFVCVDLVAFPHQVHDSVCVPVLIVKPDHDLDGGSVNLSSISR